MGDLLRLLLLSADGEPQCHHKFRALPGLALHGDGPPHHIHKALGDGHSQTGALGLADGGGLLPGELLKDMLPEFLTDADAVVPDVEFIVRIPLRRGGLLHDPQADHTAGGREFHGVGQDVQQDLVEPHGVGNDLLIHNIDGIDEQGQPLGNDVRLNDVPDVMHQIRQIHRLCLQGDPTAFDAAHIQHIVDEGQQMLAGGGDLFQVINDLIPVVNMGGREKNYLETSGSAIMAYSMLKGVRLGFLPESFRAYGEKAFHGICDRYLKEKDGRLSLGGICLVAGLGGPQMRDGTYEYYMSEPVVEDDAKGVGPFLLAYTEMRRLDD